MNRLSFLKKHIKKGRVLDIGNLGLNGELHRNIQSSFPDSFIVGIDNNEKLAKKNNFPNQVIGDITEPLPFENDYFETVYLGEIIEHTWAPFKLLEEVHRVLKEGGVVIIDTPHVYSLIRMVRFFIKGQDSLGDPSHRLFFTPIILKNLLEKCRFNVIEMTTDSKFSFKNKTINLPPVPPFKWLGSHLCVAARKL
jgi:SAM-dependent methyltransferase